MSSTYDDAQRILGKMGDTHHTTRASHGPHVNLPHAPLGVTDLLRLYANGGEATPDRLRTLQQQTRRDAKALADPAIASLYSEMTNIHADDFGDFVTQLWTILSRDHRLTVAGVCLLVLGLMLMVSA